MATGLEGTRTSASINPSKCISSSRSNEESIIFEDHDTVHGAIPYKAKLARLSLRALTSNVCQSTD